MGKKRDFRETEVSVKSPFKEIITEDIWECPICHQKFSLIHRESYSGKPLKHRMEKRKWR